MRFSSGQCWMGGLLPVVALLVAGCTKTETVFRDRPFFDDPPAAAAGFLGYGSESARLSSFTVCGNCHIGSQSEWQNTAHAGAWETLQANPNAQDFCEGCHSISERGNAAEGDQGYNAVADARYEDVQCESCHGGGLTHVSNPEASQPLASIAIGTDLTNGCAECHSGSHHPFADEWEQSRHGFAGNEGVRNRGGSCASCHEGRGALLAFGLNVDYIEKDAAETQPIVCAVCHDPHSAVNEHQLRFPIDVPNVDQNLCMKCHQRRAVPSPTSFRGPHSPQGPLLLGEDVGWIPPNFDTNIVRGTHGSAQNQELCATCHVNAFEVTDPASGDHVFSATGHLFQPIPCLDSNGIPTTGDCALSERTFASCTGAGCHGDQGVARTVYSTAQLRISNLVAQLDAQVAQVASTEFDHTDGVLTVAEGALFNQRLGEIESSATHNRFLTEALLLGSMQAVQAQYGIAPNIAPADIERRLREITVPSGR